MGMLILISSFGILLDIHYCGGKIKSIGFFTDAPSCEMQEDNCSQEDLCDHMAFSKTSCCSDDLVFSTLDPQADQAEQIMDLSSAAVVPLSSIPVSTLAAELHSVWVEDLVPRTRDLHIAYCQFLI